METAGTYVVVPFISGVFNVLIDRLAPENVRDCLRGRESTVRELSKLRTSMVIVKRVINDAEEKQDTDPDVKSWLNGVKHIVYDTEDLFDKIHTEALQKKMESETQSTQDVGQVLSNIAATFGRIVVALDPFHEGIDSRIREINQRFEEFSQLIHVLDLKFGLEQPRALSSSRRTSSFMDESMICGRDSEREQIIRILEDAVPKAHEQGSLFKGRKFLEDRISVLAITGLPGIGKTTLAQIVYNDPRVDDIFELKSWTCVPETFDIIQIIRSILSLLPEPSYNNNHLPLHNYMNDLELNQSSLRRRVAGKRILVVLDDVWDDNLNACWQALLLSLKSAAPGSAIIVTSRNEDIAKMLHPTIILPLRELPDDDSWALFKLYAFGDTHGAPVGKLEAIGKMVVAKCKGLPLASKVLGSLLSSTLDAREWEIIASSKMWDLAVGKKLILPALLLSYNYLPAHLKRCFAYCSIFPKNYRFEKEKLVLLWMAEGFIDQERNDNRRMEDIGNIYFHDLLARSFFQASSSKKHFFLMHDLIHDLASYVMGEFSLTLESNTSCVVKGTPRHFSFMQSKYDTEENLGPQACTDRIRTFFPIGSGSSPSCYYLSSHLLQSLQLFCCLRVLSLCSYKITCLPSSIGSLKQLRYLNLSSTSIEDLPESVCDLLILQTLLLSDCKELRILPIATCNLIHLRHLDIRGTCMLEEMPEHIGKLSCLQTLTDFVVSEDRGMSIRELGGFLQLRGSLRISGLENVVAEADALAANLRDKTHLDELVLMQLEECLDVDREHERLLLALKPNTNLRELTIHFYEGGRFPDWVGDEAFCNLEVLHLKQCPNCVKLPSLGELPLLKHLLIKDFDQLDTVGVEFYGDHSESSSPFNSLVTLKFEGLAQWKNWLIYAGEAGPFPCLQELFLLDCRELNDALPLDLPSLKVLTIKNCQNLCVSLSQAPLLQELSLEEFGRVDLSSLSGLTCLTNLIVNWGKQVQDDTIANVIEAMRHLTSLESLSISTEWRISQRPWYLPSSIRSISVAVPGIEDFGMFIDGCSCLQYLHLRELHSYIQFPAGHSQLLNFLGILKCDGLTEFPIIPEGDEFGLTALNDLYIANCRRLASIPAEGLSAANLTTLSFHACENLTTLPNNMSANFPCLLFLSVRYCPLFESFPEDSFPPRLQTLYLGSCDNVRSFPEVISTCMSLELLHIEDCSAFEFFPETGLPPNLNKMLISNCENLTSLPDRMCSTLKFLSMWKCPKMGSFPQAGLPPSLESLHVFGCGALTQNYEDWQCCRLLSLKELSIGGLGDIDSFPADGSLSHSLTFLKIEHFSSLRSINCRELQRIHFLREFEIERCPALVCFSGDLPHSLCRLSIQQSRSMVQRCLQTDGQYVDEISHIPCVELDA